MPENELLKALVQLKKLSISEVSGVDDPANEIPGWLVMKARAAVSTAPYSPGESRAILAAAGDVPAAEALRKAVSDDDLFVEIVRAHTRLHEIPENKAHPVVKAVAEHLQLRQEPLTAPSARQPWHPPSDHRALPATHERQGRALPPDDGPRMGLRARLPLTSTTQPGAATLAQPLQHHAAPQLTRKPTPDQPRSQRPWAGQLVANAPRSAPLLVDQPESKHPTRRAHGSEDGDRPRGRQAPVRVPVVAAGRAQAAVVLAGCGLSWSGHYCSGLKTGWFAKRHCLDAQSRRSPCRRCASSVHADGAT